MKIYVCIMAMLMTATLQAQTNFSGTWSLKEKQHISGPDYSNGVPNKLNVQQTKDSVIIEYISIDGDNKESKSRVAYPMNGKSYTMVSAASGRKTVKHLEWTLDKKAVTFTNDIYKQGSEDDIELTRIDGWKLSPDGKQLLLHRKSVETITGSWEVNGTYEKQ